MTRRTRVIIVLGSILLVAGGLAVSYRPLVRWRVRRVLGSWAHRHRVRLSVGAISVGWGLVTLKSVTLQTARGCPLVRDARVRVHFSWTWSGVPLLRSLDMVGARLCLERFSDGQTNLDGLMHRGGGGGKAALRVSLRDSSLTVHDRIRKLDVSAEHMEATLLSRRWDLSLGRILLRLGSRSASWTSVRAWGRGRTVDRARFQGGRFMLLPGLLFTGAQGTIQHVAGVWSLKSQGGFGGASVKLWSVEGVYRPGERRARFDLAVQRFSLAKLDRILDRSRWGTILIDRDGTNIAADVHLDIHRDHWRFSGVTALSNLNVRDRRISPRDVRGLGFSGEFSGTYDAGRDRFHLDRCLLRRQSVSVSLKMDISRVRTKPRIRLSLQLPRTDCGALFSAVPRAFRYRMENAKLTGPVSGRIDLLVDFGYLTEETVGLSSHIDYRRCRIIEIPFELSASRLKKSFLQEVRDGRIVTSFTVGPSNPDYVPLDAISRHVVNAILTTEDSRFFSHHGFISREFRRALARNIIARRFRYGASSISMQLVKNVLLGREKTLARKLQELVLTAYLERHLSKRRILEIYLNVIEFGPGIYGIGKAARFYFGKPASMIEPQEAAFFSTLLPDPKRRFRFYCRGALTKRWRNWVDRILLLMHGRHRLTTQELEQALQTPVVFSRDEFRSRSACRARIRRYLGH